MSRLIPAVLILIHLAGCSTRTISSTPRTAIEQMLLSTAVDTALEKFELPQVRGRKVYVDLTNLTGNDAQYMKVAARARFAEIGATLTATPDQAEFIAEIASGCLGTEYKSFIIGIPSIPVPGSPAPMPELSLFRQVEQTGIMKFLIFVHAEGRFVALDQYYARADRDETFLLWHRSQQKDDIRESWEKADAKIKQKHTN
jgi:hypothetical protein